VASVRTSGSTDATHAAGGHPHRSTRNLEVSVPMTAYAAGSPRGDLTSLDARRQTRSELEVIGHVDGALAALHGKWKVHLLFFMARGVHRHSRLLDCLPGASKKIMTDTLRALERDGLVERTIYAEVPVRVEYGLTPLGWSLTEPLVALAEWGEAHLPEVARARRPAAVA
jgi:DNA-binding HxlR family transcriptional regulator